MKSFNSKVKLKNSVAPSYLSRGPPVLLHPERVVPLSESERFERSFQPNVALAPAQRRRRGASRPRPTNTPPQTPRSVPPTEDMLQVDVKAVIADEIVNDGKQSGCTAAASSPSFPEQTRPLPTCIQSPISFQDSIFPEECVSSEYILTKEEERGGEIESSSEPEDPEAEVLAVLGEELAEGEVGQAVLQVVRRLWAKVSETSAAVLPKPQASEDSGQESMESIQEEIATLESRLQSLREKLTLLSVPTPAAAQPTSGAASPQNQSQGNSVASLSSPLNAVIKTEPLSE